MSSRVSYVKHCRLWRPTVQVQNLVGTESNRDSFSAYDVPVQSTPEDVGT